MKTGYKMTSPSETIFALSSGPGTAGVAVVRLSGPAARSALKSLTTGTEPKPRHASLRILKDPETEARLDQAVVLLFAVPASFTGEDVVELHLHGGRAVVEGVLFALGRMPDLRLAEPGEFSRRAFENGKLDLTEAEGLNDLIHAQTASQRDQALRQMDGALRNLYENWRSRLLGHLAHLEADIDFPDEDLPEGVAAAVLPQILDISTEITQHIDQSRQGRMVRDGFRVVLLGAPNAGKSTLLNALTQTDVAIVSEEAGTTRDAIEVQLDLAGFSVRLIDTAGVREASGSIEKEGIRRALKKAEDADLHLVLVRADEWPAVPPAILEQLDHRSVFVITQRDRVSDDAMFHVEQLALDSFGMSSPNPLVEVSAKTGFGVEGLLKHLSDVAANAMSPRETASLTRMRHQQALEDALDHLARFKVNAGIDAVLAAEDARMAVRAIGSITGRVGVEDMLDIVFSDFCIGK
jgi:tRNA modification GTPase